MTAISRRYIDRGCTSGDATLACLVEVERGLHTPEGRKQRRWLNQFDVVVQVRWQTVGCRADKGVSAGVAPDIIFLQDEIR